MSNYENMTTFCLFLLCQFHIDEYDDDRCHNFRQNVAGKTCSDTTSGTNTRSKPLETKRSSSNKPLQKVAPHYVKKVVAEVVSSAEQIEVRCLQIYSIRCSVCNKMFPMLYWCFSHLDTTNVVYNRKI